MWMTDMDGISANFNLIASIYILEHTNGIHEIRAYEYAKGPPYHCFGKFKNREEAEKELGKMKDKLMSQGLEKLIPSPFDLKVLKKPKHPRPSYIYTSENF